MWGGGNLTWGPHSIAPQYPRGWRVHAPQYRNPLSDITIYPQPGRDALDQPLPVMAAANEQFKKAKALGLGESDFAAVYEASAAQPSGSNGSS